jgi:predicted DNA repair protein MutK
MSVGLVALLDDIAALARAAAASIDDVAGMAAKASAKAAGVVIDDAAVTPQYVAGLSPKRELPIIWRIARNSMLNKLFLILPIALLLAEYLPVALPPLLMLGGAYLCFEGAEKLIERFGGHAAEKDAAGAEQRRSTDEKAIVASATRTDIILSAEIMVISMNEVLDQTFWARLAIMVIVAVLMTVVVYGAVAILVKLDDVGLAMSKSQRTARARFGRGLVNVMPHVFDVIAWVGTIAMLWVGGHLWLVNLAELGVHAPYDFVHHLEGFGAAVPGIGAALGWLINTACSFVFGVVLGSIIVGIVHVLPFGKSHAKDAEHGTPEAGAPKADGAPNA